MQKLTYESRKKLRVNFYPCKDHHFEELTSSTNRISRIQVYIRIFEIKNTTQIAYLKTQKKPLKAAYID